MKEEGDRRGGRAWESIKSNRQVACLTTIGLGSMKCVVGKREGEGDEWQMAVAMKIWERMKQVNVFNSVVVCIRYELAV